MLGMCCIIVSESPAFCTVLENYNEPKNKHFPLNYSNKTEDPNQIIAMICLRVMFASQSQYVSEVIDASARLSEGEQPQ